MLASETVLLLSGTLEVAEDALAAVSTDAAFEPVAEELLSAVLDVCDAVLTVLSEPCPCLFRSRRSRLKSRTEQA